MKFKLLSIAVLLSAFACKSEGNAASKQKTVTKKETAAVKNSAIDMAVASTKELDLDSSALKWEGHKLTEKHFGVIKFKSGQVKLNAANEMIGGMFEVDMNTIDVQDMEAGEWRTKLINHLKNEDFFNVTKFPTSKLVIKSVSKKEGKLTYTADLTILETTKSVEFTASANDGMVTIDTFEINRTDWNIKYNSKSFFTDLVDKYVIKDEVTFSGSLALATAAAM